MPSGYKKDGTFSGKPFVKGMKVIPWNTGKHLSDDHKRKLHESNSGEKSATWKGGLPKCTCGKTISYVSKSCVKCAARKGKDNNMWKGGITPENRRIRGSSEYKDWRIKVFQRDDYTCQDCGSRGIYLHADHIKPFAYYPELRLVIENGRTLCRPCHSKTDTYMGRTRWKHKNQTIVENDD